MDLRSLFYFANCLSVLCLGPLRASTFFPLTAINMASACLLNRLIDPKHATSPFMRLDGLHQAAHLRDRD